MTNSNLTGNVHLWSCNMCHNKQSCDVKGQLVHSCVCERVYYCKRQCGYTSSWQMSHACRWSPLRLPLNLCSKLKRNPGGLPGLCAQLNICHILIFKGSKIDARVHSPSSTLYTPPVKPVLPGEPVPELLTQSKYETSCTFEVHLHVSDVYFYLCNSPYYNFYPFLPFYDGNVIVIKIDSLPPPKKMLGQHIEKCAEQADNRELEKKRETVYFPLPLFYLLFESFWKPDTFDACKFWSKTIIAISVLANPCRTFPMQMCSVLQTVVFTTAYPTLH